MALGRLMAVLASASIVSPLSAEPLGFTVQEGNSQQETGSNEFQSPTIEATLSLRSEPTVKIGPDRGYPDRFEASAGDGKFASDWDNNTRVAPLLRHNFTIGTRFILPEEWILGGALTETEGLNLSGNSPSNFGGDDGIHWFLQEDIALTFHFRFFEVWDGRREEPNASWDASSFHFGLSWFF